MANIVTLFGVQRRRPADEPALPSLPRMAGNLVAEVGRSAVRVVRGQPVAVPDEVREARLEICKGCEHFRQSDQRCSKCGCGVQGIVLDMTRWASKQCADRPPRWLAWNPPKPEV